MQATTSRQTAAGNAGVLDRLPVGLAGVDRTAKIVFLTAPASRVLGAGDVLGIHDRRLRARQANAQHRLDRALTDVLRLGDAGEVDAREVILPRPSIHPPLRLCIMPVTRRSTAESVLLTSVVKAVVAICDPSRPPVPTTALLTRMFGATEMEATLAVALSRGTTVAGFARSRDISIHTARSHFRRLKRNVAAADMAGLVRTLVCAALVE